MNRDFRGDNRPRETRINERVRAREVRLIDEDAQMMGVMTSAQALQLARERGLDLVEVSPMASPPVCKLMDYGRHKYEQAKRESEARKHQKTTELKEIRMRPRTDDHDLQVKVRKIEEFLAEGDKVKVGVIFRGREMAHPELGRQLLERVIAELKGAANVERLPSMEGKMISMIVSRAPGWEPAKKTAPASRERRTDHPAVAAAQGANTDGAVASQDDATAAGSATSDEATDNGATGNGATTHSTAAERPAPPTTDTPPDDGAAGTSPPAS